MLAETFQKPKPILGTVQLLPLPGAPGWNGRLEDVASRAEQEAAALASGGVDGILLENFYDTPYHRGRIDPAGAIAIAMVASRIHRFIGFPLGISVLQNDPETALAIAMNIGAAFIRVPVLAGARVTESGIIESHLYELAEYRNKLKISKPPKIFADVTANHILPKGLPTIDTMVDSENRILTLIQATQQAGADALILSELPFSPENAYQEGRAFRQLLNVPVFLEDSHGLSYTVEASPWVDGVLLSSAVKKDTLKGHTEKPSVDMRKVEEWVAELEKPFTLPERMKSDKPALH